MTDSPAYFAWHPRLEKKDVVGILLRRAREHRPPGSNQEFMVALLEACDVSASPVVLVAHPLFTPYFTGGPLEECYLVFVMVDGEVAFSSNPVRQAPVIRSPTHFSQAKLYAPVTVIADFARRVDASRCRTHLKRTATPDAFYNRLDLRHLPSGEYQLRVEVGEVAREHADSLLGRAVHAVRICGEHGGRTQASQWHR